MLEALETLQIVHQKRFGRLAQAVIRALQETCSTARKRNGEGRDQRPIQPETKVKSLR